jgi:AcrR family transcriptional regulator
MSAVEDRPRRGRGRRPADEVRAEILAAAGDLLFAEGMTAFTIDKVAALSGASKMTIYKWWPSKGALALDGYFHRVEDQLQFPDSGDVETDLDLKASFLQRYSAPRRDLAVATMATAKERGQLRADLDPETVVDQLWGACYHRLLIPDQPLTEAFVDALVDNLFRGITPRR